MHQTSPASLRGQKTPFFNNCADNLPNVEPPTYNHARSEIHYCLFSACDKIKKQQWAETYNWEKSVGTWCLTNQTTRGYHIDHAINSMRQSNIDQDFWEKSLTTPILQWHSKHINFKYKINLTKIMSKSVAHKPEQNNNKSQFTHTQSREHQWGRRTNDLFVFWMVLSRFLLHVSENWPRLKIWQVAKEVTVNYYTWRTMVMFILHSFGSILCFQVFLLLGYWFRCWFISGSQVGLKLGLSETHKTDLWFTCLS